MADRKGYEDEVISSILLLSDSGHVKNRDTFVPQPASDPPQCGVDNFCLLEMSGLGTEGVTKRLSLENDVSCDFSAGSEWLLWFAVQVRFDPSCISQGQNELVLSLPVRLLAWSKERLLRTAVINLHHHPTQLGGFQIQDQLSVLRGTAAIKRDSTQRTIRSGRRGRDGLGSGFDGRPQGPAPRGAGRHSPVWMGEAEVPAVL